MLDSIPPLSGILETALYVEDPERSRRFYQAVFGFGDVSVGERLIALEAGPRQVLLLFKKRASRELPLTPHDGDGQLHLAFAISADALDAWAAHLQRLGIAILERKTWERGGVSLYFRDPDGHLLEVATPGVWPRVY